MSKEYKTPSFWCGTSGLALPFKKIQFPPEFKEKSRLHYYASLFNSIEFNNTFYKLPRPSTVNNWAESVPEDFRFTFKVPKSITHSKNLSLLDDIPTFLKVVGQVGDKKGCLLAQFPPSFAIEQMEALTLFLQAFTEEPDFSSWQLAVEFRHPSWQHPNVNHLLKDFNVTRVVHDLNNEDLKISRVIGNIVYIRLHGPEPRYRGSYSDEYLKQLSHSVVEWLQEKKTVYVYFNNTMGNAFHNVETLSDYVKQVFL